MSLRKWETADEIEYLRRLTARLGTKARLAYLRRYRDQLMPRRHNWGDIDPKVVRCYLDMEIGTGT